MKRAVTILSAAVLAIAFGTPVMAQQAPLNRDINQTEVRNFDHFLDNHPNVAKRLAANPRLVNDPQYIARHPELHEFMQNHPGVRDEIHETPGQFMSREGHYEWNREGRGYRGGEPIRRGEVASADNYLDHHPEVAEQLQKNPRLIDNSQFVDNHPGLHEYLENHPGARHDFKAHPYRFIRRERRYDRHEGEHSWNNPGRNPRS